MSVTVPGALYTMPLSEYIADPAPEPSLSASVAHRLITESPLHAFMHHPRLNPGAPREESSKADIGTIAHGILLEGDESRVVLIDAEDWRTKAAKEQRDAVRALGKMPLLAHQMGPIRKMVEVAKEAIAGSELAHAFTNGTPERTLLWQEGDIWLRSRPDWLTHDHELIVDYKTTTGSAEPNAWMRTALGNGNDLQAALGMRGLRKVCAASKPRVVFLVQEQEAPYAVSFVGLDPAFVELAEKKVARAIRLWIDCMGRNQWPSYPSRVCWMAPPSWAVSEEEGKL